MEDPIFWIQLLESFGITKDKITPLLIFGIAFLLISRKYFYKPLEDRLKNIKNKDCAPIKNCLSNIKNAVIEIQDHLNKRPAEKLSPMHGVQDINLYGESQSPMKPNKEGEKILIESGFAELYPEIKKDIFKILDENKTRTLYDAEANAFNALAILSKREEFDNLKHFAVNNPKKPLPLIFLIASWVIRSDYAKEKNLKK